MARVIVTPSFAREHLGAIEEFELEAGNLFQLVAALEQRFPGFESFARIRTTFAVDGTVVNDWSTPLTADSEVLLVPRIGGG